MNLSEGLMDNSIFPNLFEGGSPALSWMKFSFSPEASVLHADLNLIRQIHNDLATIFAGLHPDFQKNTLPYHNLRHSQMVVLATIRLFDGLHYCNQYPIPPTCS